MNNAEVMKAALELVERDGRCALSAATRCLLAATRSGDRRKISHFRQVVESVFYLQRTRSGQAAAGEKPVAERHHSTTTRRVLC